jgi:hypothetical protein
VRSLILKHIDRPKAEMKHPPPEEAAGVFFVTAGGAAVIHPARWRLNLICSMA